jgi:hypothetical protein
MQCATFDYSKSGTKFKAKVPYDTQDQAIAAAKIINSRPKQIHKVVPYKCQYCGKWYIGKGKTLVKTKQRLWRMLKKK